MVGRGPEQDRHRIKPHLPERLRDGPGPHLRQLAAVLSHRWSTLARDHFPADTVKDHRVEFSKLITSSWAIIYYRRKIVRLSPYLFLLEERELNHGSYWRELDATIKHELVHAFLYHRDREIGHPPEFAVHLKNLGIKPNGGCDRGPLNAAFRYVYSCKACHREWRRRAKLPGNWSCGVCSPGVYNATMRMELARTLPSPWERLVSRSERVEEAVEAGLRALGPEARGLEMPPVRRL